MRWLLVSLAILALITGYSYITVSNGPIEPLGRNAFVKLLNPDFYPGHPHSELFAQQVEKTGSKVGLILHMYDGSNYRSYPEGDVYIIQVAYIDIEGAGSIGLDNINYLDSLKVALFGVPEGRYKYMSDGKVYDTYEEMMEHVNELAQKQGQQGPVPMAYHGNARIGNPILEPGDGFPLYFQILTKEYGIIPAYVYMISGMIYPYFNNPYRNFELQHASKLQDYYNQGLLNKHYMEVNTSTKDYYTQLYQNNTQDYE
ncbi:MAG: hypothetical protein PQ975_01510 [Methanobacterium sp.]|jgi:hypothetical protein